jgi:xylose isomerase
MLLLKLVDSNYVFWGGREGYMSLLNTDMETGKTSHGPYASTCRDYARAKVFTELPY